MNQSELFFFLHPHGCISKAKYPLIHCVSCAFQAILAAVVIANLIGLLKQFTRLKALWYIYRPDAVRCYVT